MWASNGTFVLKRLLIQMNKGKKIINTLKYLPILATAFLAQETFGQQIVWPTGVMNPFLSPDTTQAAIAHNKITKISEINSVLRTDVRADWIYTIPPNDNPLWNCNQWSNQMVVNSHDWGKEVFDSQWDKLLCNGYKGFVLSEIYANGGTLKDIGKLGYQMFEVSITDKITRPEGHAMNGVFTGNDILDPESFNTIEPRDGVTEVKPGEINIPLNCERFVIAYPYIFKNTAHEKIFGFVRILEFKIVNGEKILTYNINDDPFFNKTFRVITKRDTVNPVIKILSPVNGKVYDKNTRLEYIIEDENFKPGTAWYSLDGGKTKIPAAQSDTIPLSLADGMYKFIVGGGDEFRLTSKDSVSFEMKKATGIEDPPTLEETVAYPNPTYDILHIKYKSGMSGNAFMSIYTLGGNPVMRKTIGSLTEEDLDMTQYNRGLYIMIITDGTERKEIKLIIE